MLIAVYKSCECTQKIFALKHYILVAAMKIVCNGTTGHGSLLHANTAGEKLWKVLDAVMDFRETQVEKLSKQSHPIFGHAEVTTINVTVLQVFLENGNMLHCMQGLS